MWWKYHGMSCLINTAVLSLISCSPSSLLCNVPTKLLETPKLFFFSSLEWCEFKGIRGKSVMYYLWDRQQIHLHCKNQQIELSAIEPGTLTINYKLHVLNVKHLILLSVLFTVYLHATWWLLGYWIEYAS